MSPSTRPPRLLERPPRDDLDAEARAMILGAEEPLPDAVRARTWAGLQRRFEGPSPTRQRASRWLHVAGAIAAAAAVLLAVVWALPPAGGPVRALDVRGRARLAVGSGGFSRLADEQEFDMPARLEVDSGASAEVRLARGVDIRVDGPATLRIERRGVQMESGRAAHAVRKGRGPWVVQLGRYSVVVRGTQFWTGRSGGEAAVCLLEGSVQVRAGAELLATLAPGEAWRSSPRAPAFPPDLACRLASDGARPGRIATAAAARDRHGESGASIAAATTPPEGSGPPRSPGATSLPGARAWASGTSSVDAREGGAEPPRGASLGATGRGSAGVRAPLAVPESTAGLAPAAPAPPSPPEELLPLPEAPPSPPPPPEPERPACAGAPDPAGCLRALADGSDLRAQAALYRLGEVHRAHGNAAGALDAWLEYRRRFPAGALAQEADLAILEMRLRVDPGAARRAADRFLTHWPGSEHAAEVAAIRGALRQRAGDCAGALGDFDRALGARASPSRREEALFGRAACLEAAGRTADATIAYRTYLRERPDGRFAARARAALEALER